MADRKPPRFAGDERATMLGLLQYQRDSFVRKVDGLTDEQAAASPVASGTSLLWLANHLADAETTWFVRRFAHRQPDVGTTAPGATIAAAVNRYRTVWASSDELVLANDLDAPCPPFDDGPALTLRWILAHVLEETARHAGHADILRELIDGDTGR